MQKCFVLDLNRCTGCSACSLACKIENELPPGMTWRQVVTFNESRLPHIPLFSLALACNHCIDAPCKEKCPALAYSKDKRTGAVTIDPDLCIGCKYCQWVCPYDAPTFNDSTGVMEKCTFCSHRLEENLEPACTASCPTKALQLGDYQGKNGAAPIPGFWSAKIEPAIRIEPLRRADKPPQMALPAGPIPSTAPPRRRDTEVSLRSEWPLLLFTFTASVLVALFHSWILAASPLPALPFALVGVAAMGVSLLHLGKPFRFYRAILNWRSCWVSREVSLFAAFLGGAVYCLIISPGDLVLARITAAVGFASLFAMDKVYQVDTNISSRGTLHSASVLLTGLYLVGVFTAFPLFLLPLGLAKLVLYLFREIPGLRPAKRSERVLFASRMVAGFVLPGLLWVTTGTANYTVIAASILAGEVIDRMQFYLELAFARPSTQARLDLEKLVGRKPIVLT